jgi:hypothetical protein
MLSSSLLTLGCLFAVAANAQDSGQSVITLTGATDTTPTGSYLSYASTLTVPTTTTSSAISTSVVVSTITSGSTTRTTTLGTMTIFGIGSVITGNATHSRASTQTTDSQVILSGHPHTTTALNGTANSTSTSTSSSAEPTNTTPCNNYPEFCSRPYGNITEVAAHNSPFVKTGNAASNQALDVTTQLNDGIRLLQGQVHFNGSIPHFCHSSCDILDAGPITDYLGKVYDWVSTHPYDVVTILLGNGDYSPVTKYVPFLEQTGLVQYAYQPPKIPMAITDWPTLGSMILTGKRVIFFMDYEANQTAVPYILDEFSQMWETPFDPTNRSFPCTIQRPPALLPKDAPFRLYMTNHNLNYNINILGNSLLVPNIPLLNITNDNGTEFGSLGLSTQQCNDTWNYPPKFLNVDYYNVGNGSVFEVAAKYNNVTYNRVCCGKAVSTASRLHEVIGRSTMLLAICLVGVSLLLL